MQSQSVVIITCRAPPRRQLFAFSRLRPRFLGLYHRNTRLSSSLTGLRVLHEQTLTPASRISATSVSYSLHRATTGGGNGASAEIMVRHGGHDPQAAPGSAATYLCLGPGFSSASNTPAPGRSLVPAFHQDVTVDRDFLWWLHEGNRAIRVGNWKLVAAKNDLWELYDLSDDRSESHNLAQERSEKAKELEDLWNRQLEAMSRLAAKTAPQRSQKKRSAKSKPRER